MRKLEDVVALVDKDKDYDSEIDRLSKEDLLSNEDNSLLKYIFSEYRSGSEKTAWHLLTWVGDTYIREKFVTIVLKLQEGGK